MHKAAYVNKAVDFAEDMVSQQLADKYRRSLAEEKKRKRRFTREKIQNQAEGLLKKRPIWWENLNKGLLVEFLIFLISQGFNFFTNVWVLIQVTDILVEVRFYQSFPNITRVNYTVPGICRGFDWNTEVINRQVKNFENVTIVYYLFISLTSMLVLLHTISWLYTLYLSMEKKEIGEKGREVLVKMKLLFLVGGSFLEDIPLSTITAKLFAIQQGRSGITCWLCRVSGKCTSNKVLLTLLDASQKVLVLNVCAITVTSLWKGISSFYRWSRIPNFELFYIRAATSLFAGFLFVIVILTPAMLVLSYDYFALPGVSATFIKDIIDRIVVIGIIFWVIVLTVLFCCPLLFLIRVGNK